MLRLGRFDKFQAAIVIALAASAIGYGVWSTVSTERLDSARRLPVALRDAGWRLEFDAQSVAGFPARADLTLASVSIEPGAATPSWPFRLSVPSLLTRSLIYRPDYLGLEADNGFTIETPTGDLAIEGDVAASVVLGDAVSDGETERRALERVSISGPSLRFTTFVEGVSERRREGAIGLAELHLRADPDGDAATRRLFIRLDDLTLDHAPAAAIDHVRLDALLQFLEPPTTGAGLGLDAVRLDLGAADAPGLIVAFSDGRIALSGALDRQRGAWGGLLGFVTNDGPAVLAHLEALDLLTEDEAAAIRGRIAPSGRLAGVLKLWKARLTIEDIQPEAIPIAMPARPSMETFWRLR